MLQKAREATAARKWREAASYWLDASAASPIAAWAVGRALNAMKSPAALRFVRAAAYSGHPQAIDFMASRDGNAMQKGYWGRFSPHITVNGQLPPDEPEALKQLLRQHKGANSSYIEGWAHQHGVLGQGADTGIAYAHEFYRTAALEGHPLAAIGYLRTWDPYYAQDSFESAVTLVANASNACPPALFVLGEQMVP